VTPTRQARPIATGQQCIRGSFQVVCRFPLDGRLVALPLDTDGNSRNGGDMALRLFAEVLKQSIRDADQA
jgi:hypothetical protein